MSIMRYVAHLCVLYCVVCAALGGRIPTCLGGDPSPHDLVLLHFFGVTKEDEEREVRFEISQIGFCKDGKTLACYWGDSASPYFGHVKLLDITTGKRIPCAETPDRTEDESLIANSFANLPYARLSSWMPGGLEVRDDLATATLRPIRLKHLQRGTGVTLEKGDWLQYPIKGEGRARMGMVVFSMDDAYLAALRFDRSINVWNTRTGERMWRFALPGDFFPGLDEIHSMAFDPTNRYLAAGIRRANDSAGLKHRPMVKVWDLKTGKEVLHAVEEIDVSEVTFSSNGDLICAGGDFGYKPHTVGVGRIVIRRGRDFSDVRKFNAPCGVSSLAVVPGVGIATGDWQGQVILWHFDPDESQQYLHGQFLAMAVAKENADLWITSLAASQDGKLLAAGDFSGVALVWKIVSMKPSEWNGGASDGERSSHEAKGPQKPAAKAGRE